MNVVVIGLGSMGRRRIRLLKKYDSSFHVIGIDLNVERRSRCEQEYSIITYQSLSEVPEDLGLNCAFVCTAPLSHNEIISNCLKYGLHVFTELNLVDDGYEANCELARKKNLVLFLSSTFLYREEIKHIRAAVTTSASPVNYTYHVGQYLPDWHPWEHYTNFFVGDKRTNGCREIFAIELPWLLEVFGDVIDVQVKKNRLSGLDIGYDDNYLLMIEHASGSKGLLAVDVISRKAVRNLEIFNEQLYVTWNGSPTGFFEYDFTHKRDVNIQLYDNVDSLDGYSSFVIENAYYQEIESFFAVMQGKEQPMYSFEKDKKTLSLIDLIEGFDER
ncbi:Gfo/Idh/MocA family oxidoreductase [Sphaerochaeta sp. PS]|uniref:Gfo/Idh/MocA family protein n=1 Tax=Sphaerochaeta sp. PS TaxID=3076336 RepID=UPI0028A51853|nr:Gfo/Idh/MocA family oxidoreductase [Sphaerochaeta sp. PS]MDT4763429.1 Gfo/Idh/MocA family oxidoreductase [Sphaerochaeta sp. PS]